MVLLNEWMGEWNSLTKKKLKNLSHHFWWSIFVRNRVNKWAYGKYQLLLFASRNACRSWPYFFFITYIDLFLTYAMQYIFMRQMLQDDLLRYKRLFATNFNCLWKLIWVTIFFISVVYFLVFVLSFGIWISNELP